MSKLPIPLIVNPAAGRGRAGRKMSSLSNLLHANDIDHEVIESRARGDIEKQVQAQINDGCESVIVAGGRRQHPRSGKWRSNGRVAGRTGRNPYRHRQ